MSVPLNQEHITQLKGFIDLCISYPSILHHPDLAFLKSFIEKFGGKVPEDKSASATENKPDVENAAESKTEPESEESDLELDMTGVVEPDTDAPQEMGDASKEATEEEIAESQAKRSDAVSAFVEKEYEKALQLYTEAIVLNPQASLLYTKRGQVYLMLNKPNACIRDCNRALEINPDSAAAHKFRGRANQLLGKWEEAVNDLRLACKLDFDEQADEWLREVTPNARKIEEHKRKRERRIQEKLEHERQEKLKKAKEAAKARQESTRPSQTDAGASPGAGYFYQFLNDPEAWKAFEDPEVAEAFKDMSTNPVNIMKYQNNPKVMALINKMASKFGGAGMAGGFAGMPGMGGMPNFAGRNEQQQQQPPPPTQPEAPKSTGLQDDIELD